MLKHVDVEVRVLAADEENFAEALKGVDEGENHREKDRVPHLGRGNVEEFLKGARAVEVSGRILIFRNGDEPRQQQNDRVTRVLPQVEQLDDPKGRRAGEPFGGGDLQQREEIVQSPGLAEHQIHQHHRAHHRHDVREHEDGLQNPVPSSLLFHQESDEICQHHQKRQTDREEFHGVAERQAEHVVAEHPEIVFKAHKRGVPGRAKEEGKAQHQHKGDGVKEQAAHQQGRDQNITLSTAKEFFDRLHVHRPFPIKIPLKS